MTADETRRRIERNLYGGIQQRLVTLALELRTVNDAGSPERAALLAPMSHANDELISILDELREISRGIHPAILSHSGLGAALRSLAGAPVCRPCWTSAGSAGWPSPWRPPPTTWCPRR